jgi:hypothetical protein
MDLKDRELLARTLQAEAGNQGYNGLVAVGSVIMNRLAGGNDLGKVILQPGHFSAWNRTTGYAGGEQGQDMDFTPSARSYEVADALLAGNYEDPTGGATHYYNPQFADPIWGASGGGDWQTIGSHIFGKANGASAMNRQAITNPSALGVQTQPAGQPRQGLLGGQGIGSALGMSEDFRDKLKIAILSGSDPRGFAGQISSIQEGMQGRKAEAKDSEKRNKTLEFLSKMPNGEELVKLAEIVGPAAVAQQVLAQRFAKPKGKVRQVRGSELGMTGPQADRIFNVDEDNRVTGIGGTAPVTNINMGDKLSPGLKKLDESFAETYANLSMSGLADARSQAATINTVLTKLEAGEPLTGPLIGVLPDFLRAITSPDAQDAIDRVGSVVQRSLREVLGGQFAQREGEQLVRRAYNPSLPPAQNAARLRALFSVLDQTAKNKMDMATYYQENNYSLGGYKGNMGLPTREDLEAAMDAAAFAPQDSSGQPTVINNYTIQKVD